MWNKKSIDRNQIPAYRKIGHQIVHMGDASHLNGVVSEGLAAIIAAFALAVEHAIESSTGKAFFGAVRSK